MAATLVIVALRVTRHLTRTIPRCFEELLVNYFHKTQVLGAFADRLIVKPQPRQL